MRDDRPAPSVPDMDPELARAQERRLAQGRQLAPHKRLTPDDQLAPHNQLTPDKQLTPGQQLARGVSRALSGEHDFACAEEVTLASGLRVDVMALGPKGEIWVVECKSSRADYTSDGKWQGYLDWADRFFWAVGPDFPTGLLPEGTGLILADAYGAEIVRMGPETKLAGARRKALTLRLARLAARRAQAARDPEAPAWGG